MNLPSFGYQATTKPQLGIFQIIFFSNIAIDTVVNYQVFMCTQEISFLKIISSMSLAVTPCIFALELSCSGQDQYHRQRAAACT